MIIWSSTHKHSSQDFLAFIRLNMMARVAQLDEFTS